MQRILTTTALSCLSLLSLQGYSIPNPNDPIYNKVDLDTCVRQTMNLLFHPNHDTHDVQKMIPQAQQEVYRALATTGWFGAYISTTKGQAEKCTIAATISLLTKDGIRQMPNDISETGSIEAAQEHTKDLQFQSDRALEKGDIRGLFSHLVVANNLVKNLINIHINRIKNLYS
jgi:hypothetical protein